MRRPIERGVISAVVLFVAMQLIVLASEPFLASIAMYDWQFTTAHAIAHYNRGPAPDIVFAGGSRALSGLDPDVAEAEVERLTGTQVRAVNLSITAGPIDANYLMLKNLIRDDRKPRVIVYGFGEYELARNAALSDTVRVVLPYAPLLLRPDDFALYGGDTFERRADFVALNAVPLYRDRDLIKNAMSIAFNPDDLHKLGSMSGFGIPMNDNGAWILPSGFQFGVAGQQIVTQVFAPIVSHFEMDQARLALFGQYFELARARRIHVIFVVMPVTPEYRHLWESEAAMNMALAKIRQVAELHEVPFIDLYTNPGDVVPPDGFADPHHVNGEGSTPITRLITDEYIAPSLAASGD